MFTEEQLNQLRGLLSPIENRLGALERGQNSLEQGQKDLLSQFEAHRQESKKEHEELGGLISGLAEHTDKAIEAAHQKTVEVLTNRMKVTFEHQDKRITRIEKRLDLPPLE
ncbi:hypothetical protein ABT237_20960 [Streptomyces sp. NPDC001581]|uniref:hypothetical protein n=1 Tax=Streptomyces sp. NPDC001581 TaxID=3154386 RepID=UPI003323BA18